MQDKTRKKLQKSHTQLIEAYEEIKGYSTLMGAIYTDDCIAGSDLLGPAHALNKCALKIQKVFKRIDVILSNPEKK